MSKTCRPFVLKALTVNKPVVVGTSDCDAMSNYISALSKWTKRKDIQSLLWNIVSMSGWCRTNRWYSSAYHRQFTALVRVMSQGLERNNFTCVDSYARKKNVKKLSMTMNNYFIVSSFDLSSNGQTWCHAIALLQIMHHERGTRLIFVAWSPGTMNCYDRSS